MFKKTVEKIGDDDSDDDQAAMKHPLLLEQYEAQIHSLIRSSLQDQLKSFLYSSEIYHLIDQFLTLGICLDDGVKNKIIEQLCQIYQNKKSSKDHDYFALSQMYPEKICANSFMQKLALINKV